MRCAVLSQALEDHSLELSAGPTGWILWNLSERTSDRQKIVTSHHVWDKPQVPSVKRIRMITNVNDVRVVNGGSKYKWKQNEFIDVAQPLPQALIRRS